MNKLDSALVTSALKQAAFAFTRNAKDADAVLINTCSVRQHAEQRVLSHLGHLKHIKESKPDMVVAVIGCMAQRLGAELLEHDAVDIVCGPAQIPQIAELLTEAIENRKKTLAVTQKIRTASPDSEMLEEFESAYGIEDKAIPGQRQARTAKCLRNLSPPMA
jgi:tRNA-2-methylthio-N6-dimethylallyladenosine synthase